MYIIRETAVFRNWLDDLRDHIAVARIANRVQQAHTGHFGDCKYIGHGIYEIRIHVSSGYRLYFIRIEKNIIFFLIGGNKSSQSRDIEQAKIIAKALRETP